MEKERIYYNNSDKPTIGVEVELLILDKETMQLYPGAPLILDVFKDSDNVKQELLNSIVEINTNVCNDAQEVRKDQTV